MRSLAVNLQLYAPEAAQEMSCKLQLSTPSIWMFSGKPAWDAESKYGVRRVREVLRANGVLEPADHLPVPWKHQWHPIAEYTRLENDDYSIIIDSASMKVEGPLASLNWEL